MLILVGVTVTVAINGGLFEKTKEGAKGTTIERVKEQITADIATKIADKKGEKITKNDFKQIVEPKYGTIDESGENLILKDRKTPKNRGLHGQCTVFARSAFSWESSA